MLYVIGLLVIAGFIGQFIEKILCEEDVRKVKVKLGDWAKRIASHEEKLAIQKASMHFNDLFDSIYGASHLTWKCFRRSALISVLSAVVVVAFCLMNYRYRSNFPWFDDYWGYIGYAHVIADSTVTLDEIIMGFIGTIAPYAAINILIDYISLIETRYVLGLSNRCNTKMFLILLVFDVIVTMLIWQFALAFFACLLNGDLYNLKFVLDPRNIINTFSFSNKLLPFLLSTFSTSVLFYIFFVIFVLINLFGPASRPIGRFLRRLHMLDNPVSALVAFLVCIAGTAVTVYKMWHGTV